VKLHTSHHELLCLAPAAADEVADSGSTSFHFDRKGSNMPPAMGCAGKIRVHTASSGPNSDM
jgi:hypothetical protein